MKRRNLKQVKRSQAAESEVAPTARCVLPGVSLARSANCCGLLQSSGETRAILYFFLDFRISCATTTTLELSKIPVCLEPSPSRAAGCYVVMIPPRDRFQTEPDARNVPIAQRGAAAWIVYRTAVSRQLIPAARGAIALCHGDRLRYSGGQRVTAVLDAALLRDLHSANVRYTGITSWLIPAACAALAGYCSLIATGLLAKYDA